LDEIAMNQGNAIFQMVVQFVILSLLAFGGVNVVLPEAHRFVVDVHHWVSDQEFADFFAIAQAAPGPNFLMFALIGWKVGGITGAVAAALAIIVPAGTLAFIIGGLWHRFRNARWRRAVQAGLAPITIGLVFSSGFILSVAADHNWITFAITAATAIVTFGSDINPLWLFLGAGMLGVLGLT
jgi:chromate transporter